MSKEFQPLSHFLTSQEALDHIKDGGWVLVEQIAITNELLSELQNTQKDQHSLYPNGIFISNEKKERLLQALWLKQENTPSSYKERQNYCKQIRDFIEELKNTEVISEEQDKKQYAYALQIQKYFPKTIWLPDMIWTNYFASLTEEQYASIDNDIMNLAEELTAIYVQKKLNKQETTPTNSISQA